MERALAVDPVATRPGLRERALAVPREKLLFLLGIVAVGLHIVDDNYLQPEPGTSAGDHLTSGLVPLAIPAAVTVLYPRMGGGLRAGIAMTFGAIAITIGVPGAYYLLDGSASGDHYTGLLAIIAGAVLLVTGPVTLWTTRRREGSRRRRYLRRSLTAVVALAVAPLVVVWVVFPVGLSYMIYADPGIGGESTRQPQYYAAAGEPKAIWKVPGSKHTGGIDARPAEYERRGVAFFDHA